MKKESVCKKRVIAWMMAMVMALSVVVVPAGSAKAAETEFTFVNALAGTATVAETNDVFVDFAIPDSMTSKSGWSNATQLKVTVTANYTAKSGSDTPGVQAFFQSKDTSTWNSAWANLDSTGKSVTTTLSLDSLDWGSSTEVNRYGIQFCNLSPGSTLTYSISAIVLSTSQGDLVQKVSKDSDWETENGDISLSYSYADGYNAYREYYFTVKNASSSVVTGDLVITFDQTRGKNWWTEDYTINLSSDGKVLTISNLAIPAGGETAGIQVQLTPVGGNITSVTFGGQLIEATGSEGSLSSGGSGDSGGGSTNLGDGYTGSTTYTLPDTCVDDATTTPYKQHGELYVDATSNKICDKNGNLFQLRGVSTHGINWDISFPYLDFDSFKSARDVLNANAMRLAMYTSDYYGYADGAGALSTTSQEEIRKSLKYRVDKGVEITKALGMYCIVDWHILNDLNPQRYKEHAKEYFAYVSDRYKDYDHILYEICNEPNGGTSWADIKSYALEIIPIIRANDPDAIIIVGTPTWSQEVDKPAADPILEKDVNNASDSSALASNVMYTIHFYAATHGDNYLNVVKNTNGSIPIMCTEFSMCESSGDGGTNYDMAIKWLDYFDEQDISYFTWSLCAKGETASLLKSSASSKWSASDLSNSGSWIMTQYTNRKNINNTIVDGADDPTDNPTDDPGESPSDPPTDDPTDDPSDNPTDDPTDDPSDNPTDDPVDDPTDGPTDDPVDDPTDDPTDDPVDDPTDDPSDNPTDDPVDDPTDDPSDNPTDDPVDDPTDDPTDDPSDNPTDDPTDNPADDPIDNPVDNPTDDKQDKEVKDEKVLVQSIAINGISKKIAAGKKVQLEAVISPINATNSNVIWTSSNKKYATVNEKGLVKVKKAGAGKSVTITATAADGSGVKKSYKIKIMKNAVKKVKVTAKKKTLGVGKTLKLKVTVSPKKNANTKVIWKSSNEKVATVSKSGKVKALKKGKVKITAMATDGSNKKATITIRVK